jgi:transcriptional regulator with XRE-family HTH domain
MADRLRAWRLRRVLTQVQLAERTGVSVATIRRIEAGSPPPRPTTIQRLAVGLGVSPEVLAGTAE